MGRVRRTAADGSPQAICKVRALSKNLCSQKLHRFFSAWIFHLLLAAGGIPAVWYAGVHSFFLVGCPRKYLGPDRQAAYSPIRRLISSLPSVKLFNP